MRPAAQVARVILTRLAPAMRELFVQASYLLASVFFILGLKSLSRAETASRGVTLAASGMLVAIIGTLVQQVIIDYRWIALGLAAGAVIGVCR